MTVSPHQSELLENSSANGIRGVNWCVICYISILYDIRSMIPYQVTCLAGTPRYFNLFHGCTMVHLKTVLPWYGFRSLYNFWKLNIWYLWRQACVCDSNEVCQSVERYRELKSSSDIPMQWHLYNSYCAAGSAAVSAAAAEWLNDWVSRLHQLKRNFVLLRLLRDSANLTVNFWNHDEVSLCFGCEVVFWCDLLQRWVVSPALGTCLCYVCSVNLVFIWMD